MSERYLPYEAVIWVHSHADTGDALEVDVLELTGRVPIWVYEAATKDSWFKSDLLQAAVDQGMPLDTCLRCAMLVEYDTERDPECPELSKPYPRVLGWWHDDTGGAL